MPAHAQRVSSLLAADKEFAPCRVERRAYAMRGERALGDGSASGVDGEGPTQGCGGQGTRGAHVEHAVHVRDLGSVEAERVVERPRVLPSRKEGRTMRSEVWAGRREDMGRRWRTSGMHGKRARL